MTHVRGTPIATDRTDFRTRAEPSIGIGVYLAPLF
jgi:hypothetical protein